MWNMGEPIWMETETPNENETKFTSYAAHDYDPNVLTCGPQSMYLLCKSVSEAGFAQSTNTHFLSQQGTFAQTLKTYEDLQSVHES
jgi:hypothetical protein